MRVLVLSHLPFSDAVHANPTHSVVVALRSCAHEVRALGVALAESHGNAGGFDEASYLVDVATNDAHRAVPWVVAQSGATMRFTDMSDEMLANYRGILRAHVDAEIDRFDPDMIHLGEVGILSHLALESGVTYVATVDGREPAAADVDARLQRFVDESIENAGRLFVASHEAGERLASRYPEVADRIAVDHFPSTGMTVSPSRGAWLAASYGEVLAQRFGSRSNAAGDKSSDA